MRYQLAFAVALFASAHAAATEESDAVDAALISAAHLGTQVKTSFSEPDASGHVLGVVLSEERGKLVILKRRASGAYQLETASAPFANVFGYRYYIESVRATGARRFSIQVNAGDGCGIRLERFHFASVRGVWRVSGYDKVEPQTNPCDVNYPSREYSANLLTRQVAVVNYSYEKIVNRESRRSKIAAPALANFSFSIFETKP